MDAYFIHITLLVLCLPFQCLTAPLEDTDHSSKEQFGQQDPGFKPSTNEVNFQSWSDWLQKRSFGEYPFGDQNLQAWKEWMEKRGLHPGAGPTFGAGYGNGLQQWKDWMEKRGFSGTGNEAFQGAAPIDKAHFQTWTDWLSKRGLGGMGAGGSGFGQPSGGGFQSWGDYSKRSGSDLVSDYVSKRSFGVVKPSNPFNVQFGSNHNLMKWDDMFKRFSNKRQLGSGPVGFGHYNQYFTNGLQDWRNTFQKSKRASSNAKSSKHENN